jgi:hypothetical protein
LHAVKLNGERDEAHKDLTRHHGMSPVATGAKLYHVYRTWESPRRCKTVAYTATAPLFAKSMM